MAHFGALAATSGGSWRLLPIGMEMACCGAGWKRCFKRGGWSCGCRRLVWLLQRRMKVVVGWSRERLVEKLLQVLGVEASKGKPAASAGRGGFKGEAGCKCCGGCSGWMKMQQGASMAGNCSQGERCCGCSSKGERKREFKGERERERR